MDGIGDNAESAEDRELRLNCCIRYRFYWVLPLIVTGIAVVALGVVTIALSEDSYANGPGTGFWIFMAGTGFVGLWLGFLACASHCIHGRDAAWRRRFRENQEHANHQRLEEAAEANAAEEVVFDSDSDDDDVEGCQPGFVSTSEIELDNPNK